MCFRSYKRAWRQQQRERRAAEGVPAPCPTHSIQKPGNAPRRWPTALIEQLKRTVVEIPKYPNRPETIRVSLVPRGAHRYVDLRVYRAGYPTRQGVVLHTDLVPAVLAGLQQALGVAWEALPRREDRALWPEDSPASPWRQGETSVHFPPEWG
jgi:hypothetical protein